MELLHGSFTRFKEFKISEELARHDIQTVLPEGLGVYLTDDIKIAKSYGDIIYTVEVVDIYDFSNIDILKKEVYYFLEKFDYNNMLRSFFSSKESNITFDGAIDGDISIIKLITELWNMHEEFIYMNNHKFDLFEYQDELEKKWKEFLEKKVIKYYQKGFNCNIFIAKNADLLKIKEVR